MAALRGFDSHSFPPRQCRGSTSSRNESPTHRPTVVNARHDPRGKLPSVDKLLREPATAALIARHGRARVVDALRDVLQQAREATKAHGAAPGAKAMIDTCSRRLVEDARPTLRRVFNLTGTVVHTNLGRALMPQAAVDAVALAMTNAVNLEYDLAAGERGERDRHVESLLCELTGAEAALVVNNNAAAVFLALNTLALGREVPVSRGELVEIGGTFRVPDIMKRAGATLVEVGTTNRTHPADYEAAIGPATALLMKVHTSNYHITGFTAAVDEAVLGAIAHRHRLPLVTDLGSGSLLDLERLGLPHEPTPREKLAQGADLVTFSGDKLLGGPQAGIIAGGAALIDTLRHNPLKRALRVGKMTLAALEAVLRAYRNPDTVCAELPALRALTRPLASIEQQAARLLAPLRDALGARYAVWIATVSSQPGSGALPAGSLESRALAAGPAQAHTGVDARALASAFRALPVPVIGRVHGDAFILDLRGLGDEEAFIAQLRLLNLEAPA